MRLHFEPDLDFQTQAVDAVCDLFRGQEAVLGAPLSPMDFGHELPLSPAARHGNSLLLPDDALLANLREIQEQNGIVPATSLRSMDFTVEMETGTGKTYVYLKTIHELHRRYGFTKFIIVVPSIAIKEGVYKSLQVTESHFRALYSGIPTDYFLYDSTRLGRLHHFAYSPLIQIMVVTVGAINKKDVNNLYKEQERTGGEAPIQLIQRTRPIVIVDEPQSVDGGLAGRGRTALARMNPLCTLRYSATHVDRYHMVYRLDAVDAYQRGLVKRIEVASASIEDAVNVPYVRVVDATHRRGIISARLEVLDNTKGRTFRKVRMARDGDDLESLTKHGAYRGHRIGEISVLKGYEFVELLHPAGAVRLSPGHAWNAIDDEVAPRQMIRRTIREHLDKEKRLGPKGIKVLSLFFIDAVERYRQYDEHGNAVKGEYARIFEEEYRALATTGRASGKGAAPASAAAEHAHEGYFSIDRKGGWTDTSERNQAGREAAGKAYNLIMKEKETLLSPETPLRFLFSHSALREGWDNPNVFQICTLREIRGTRQRRQTIGRGLRLAVDREGKRVRSEGVNILTVIASESYEDFAKTLQREIEKETGVRFGVVERRLFASIPVGDGDPADSGEPATIGTEHSAEIWDGLRRSGYLGPDGEVLDTLREALRVGGVDLPNRWEPQRAQIVWRLGRVAGALEIRDADERRVLTPRREILEDSEFAALWDRVKRKSLYRMAPDPIELEQSCVRALRSGPPVPRAHLEWRRTEIEIDRTGVEATATAAEMGGSLSERKTRLPDIVEDLRTRTNLPGGSICRILLESGRLDDFRHNPQRFIEMAGSAIRSGMNAMLADGVKYERLGPDSFYSQTLFTTEELHGHLTKNLLEVRKSVYSHLPYDSETEKKFAQDLEIHTQVKMYAKLPRWFRIPTPLGDYNPDWAVLVRIEEEERLYFVVETKGSVLAEDLRSLEKAKTDCALKHFQAIGRGKSPAKYVVRDTVRSLFAEISTRSPSERNR